MARQQTGSRQGAFINSVTGKRSARHIIGVSLLALAAFSISAFSMAFFLVNAEVVYWDLSGSKRASVLLLNDGFGSTYAGERWNALVPVLQKWSVDLSAMTPFKLSLFFLYLTVNSVRSLTGRLSKPKMLSGARSLPFFRSLETTLVQLGLAGTIWGFLLIGWHLNGVSLSTASGTTDALSILLKAFGTALVSTFTGVVLAYICSPLVRSLWRWLHALDPAAGDAAGLKLELTNLSTALRENVQPTSALSVSMSAANKSAASLNTSVTGLTTQIEKTRTELERRSKLGEIETWFTNMAAGAKAVSEALNGVKPPADGLAKQVTSLTAQLKAITDALSKGNPLAETEKKLSKSLELLGEIKAGLLPIQKAADAGASSMGKTEQHTGQLVMAAVQMAKAVNDAANRLQQIASETTNANTSLQVLPGIQASLKEISTHAEKQVELQMVTNQLLWRLLGGSAPLPVKEIPGVTAGGNSGTRIKSPKSRPWPFSLFGGGGDD
jgi:hypothetical protein